MALKPIVQGMGMSWGSQHTKLSADPSRFNYTVIGTVGADGHSRDMAAIPLRRYPMWLATINPAKIPNPAVLLVPLSRAVPRTFSRAAARMLSSRLAPRCTALVG